MVRRIVEIFFLTSLASGLSCSEAPIRPANPAKKDVGDSTKNVGDSTKNVDDSTKNVGDSTPGTSEEGGVEQPVNSLPKTLLPAVQSISVTNAKGEAPKKGDDLKVSIKIENKGSKDGDVNLIPTLSSTKFTDFANVPLSSVAFSLKGGEQKEVTFAIPVLLENKSNSMRFALGRGAYKLNVQLAFEGGKVDLDKPKEFEIAKGAGVFVLVLYDKRYFDINGAKGADPEKWVTETMTRKSSIYYQDSKTKKIFPGGFDEMLGIRHIVKAVGELDSKDDGSDVFDKPEALATKWLGLSKKWEHGSDPGTNTHGYDYFIALDYDLWGGVTFGAAQVSGIGDETKDRMQIIMVHETGHVFGAPHCDPIQGYVMCSGEKNDAYKESGEFVWLDDSRNSMRNIFE